MAAEDVDQFFAEHGISPEVWRARPYIRWTKEDVTPVREAYSGFGSEQYMAGLAKQCPGWLMERHAPPGLLLPPICAEIRPDSPVRTRPPTKHYHGPAELVPPPPELCPNHAKRYCAACVSPYRVYSEKAMRKHIDRSKDKAKPRSDDDHRGVNSNVAHYHDHRAKYVFPPSPMVARSWSHAHDTYYKRPESRAQHIERRHCGIDSPDRHDHVELVKDRLISLAKRLDVHPLAIPKFADSKTVFFVIEGCIKADAVLTAGAAVFSVPSVTLWDCDELSAFADRYLVGKTVVVVPDMDWRGNPAVSTQARLCQTRLRRLGIPAHVAAPPEDANLKGIDDFLGCQGCGSLADLDVIDRDPAPGLLKFVWGHAGRRDQALRNADVLHALSMHADIQGRVSTSLRSIARIMDVHPQRVVRGLQDLIEIGAVAIEGDLATGRKWMNQNGRLRRLQENWEATPIITVAPELRAIDRPRKLGNYEEL